MGDKLDQRLGRSRTDDKRHDALPEILIGHSDDGNFLDPVVIESGAYRLPTRAGYSAEMRPESLARYRYPDGEDWATG